MKEDKESLINELKNLLGKRSTSRATIDRYIAEYLIDKGYRKVIKNER